MSLGRTRGAALIGRPLDISVQAVLDEQEDPSATCVEADVFYADNRIGKSNVRVTVEKASSGGQDALIRIRSSVLVDEPVVSLYVRAGCQQKSERRYVMLADLVTELPVQSLPIIVPSGAGTTGAPVGSTAANPVVVSPVAKANSTNASGESAGSRQTRRGRVRPAVAGQDAAPASAAQLKSDVAVAIPPKSANSVRGTTRAAEKNRSRLKLEPLDLTIDRDPQLKASSEMLSVPAATEQERSVAAALWRTLNVQPQDVLRDAEKLRNLENSVLSLRTQTQKNQQAIEGLNVELETARSERYANLLVYALGLLLLLALVAVAYLWRQRYLPRDDESDELPWWRKNKLSEKGWANSALDSAGVAGAAVAAKKTSKKGKQRTDSELDFDLGLNQSQFTEVKHMSGHGDTDLLPPLPKADRPDFAMSMTAPSRAVKAEELFDVQQQADFFVSLGQHEQAIQVLRSHIDDTGQTSALVYLDLFNLYHQLDRRDDYEALREEFDKLFNAKIPAFDFYTASSPGLEAYEAALSRIEALWPSPKVLEVIEESIFRKPDATVKAFDLGAYRELLLLYAVAREIINPEANKDDSLLSFDLPDSSFDGEDSGSHKFLATSIQPLSAIPRDDRHGETTPIVLSAVPRPSARLGLDIDLSELASDNDAPNSGAESDSRFFAQFVGSLQDVSPTPSAPAYSSQELSQKPEPSLDNLIDFDAFDASSDSFSVKKPPKP